MLIVWRRPGQSLIVGEDVEIQVLESRPNRVKLGIVAPDIVSIVRGECRITREENMAAALSAGHEMIDNLLARIPQRAAAPETSTQANAASKS